MSKANTLTIFFVSVLIFIFITLPTFEGFLGEKRKLDNKKEDFRKQEQYFKGLKEISLNLKDYSSEIEMVDWAISDDSIVPSLIRYLEISSQNNGLFFGDVKSFSKSRSERFPDLRELELTFFVSGSYRSFKSFIKTLENSIKIIEIKNFSISSDPEDQDQEELLLYGLTIKTYLY